MSESVATMPVETAPKERKRRLTSELAKLGSPTSAAELNAGRSTRSAAKGVAPSPTPPKRRSGAKKEKVEEVKKAEKKEKVEKEKVEEEKAAAVPEPEVAEEKPEEVADGPVEEVAAEKVEDAAEPVAEVAEDAVAPTEPEPEILPEPEPEPAPEPEPEIAEEVAAPKEVVTIEADAADIIQPEAAPVDEVVEWMLTRES